MANTNNNNITTIKSLSGSLAVTLPPPPKEGYVTELELVELMRFCQQLFTRHRSIDYYSTIFGIGLIILLGILGNAGTLLTLSGRRLTTATFVYYRAIAACDLVRCFFVFSYFLRVVVPFRAYYNATWYEAHLMYFGINTLSFVSTCLAMTLCVRLCIGILQSRRLKKTKTNPKTTRIYIYITVAVALAVNVCLCFEYDVVRSVNYCTRNRSIRSGEYMFVPSSFHAQNVGLLQAIHLLPIVILLLLLCGAGSILGCCLYAMPRATTRAFSRRKSIPPSASASASASAAHHPPPPPYCPPRTSSSASNAALLVHHCPSIRHSRPWRTQRQLCKLFLLLSFCYAVGLLPEFLNMVIFSKVDGGGTGCNCNASSSAENYRIRIRRHFDRENFAAVSNIFQNIGHALCFYVYILCSEAFRAEFVAKLRRWRSRCCSAIWPYSRVLGCANVASINNTTSGEKMSHTSDTTKQHPLRSVTLLADLDSIPDGGEDDADGGGGGFAATFAPELVIADDHHPMSIELLPSDASVATAAVSYYAEPVFTLAALARRMSTQLYAGLTTDNNGSRDHHQQQQIVEETDTGEILSPVQLRPNRYHSFYKSQGKKRDAAEQWESEQL